MKFTKEDYAELKKRVSKITQESLNCHAKAVKETGGYKNLEVRLIWDIYWACGISDRYLRPKYFMYSNYPYTDAHIETAARKVIKEVGLVIG